MSNLHTVITINPTVNIINTCIKGYLKPLSIEPL